MFEALFSARGRMRRRDWWLWSIGVVIAVVISDFFMHHAFGTSSFSEDMAFKGVPANGLHYWLIFVMIAGEWPHVCLLAKRWHDRNRSGWLAAIGPVIYLPKFALAHWGDLVSGLAPQFAVGMVQAALSLAGIVYALWALIDCGILDGTPGPNAYGPSPKGVGAQPEDLF